MIAYIQNRFASTTIQKRAENIGSIKILDLINPYYNYKTVAQLGIDIYFDFLFSTTYGYKRIGLFFNYMPISRQIYGYDHIYLFPVNTKYNVSDYIYNLKKSKCTL